MKHYVRIVLNFIFISFSIGFLMPFLVSQPDDVTVIGGIIYLFLVFPVILYYVNRAYVKAIVEKFNER